MHEYFLFYLTSINRLNNKYVLKFSPTNIIEKKVTLYLLNKGKFIVYFLIILFKEIIKLNFYFAKKWIILDYLTKKEFSNRKFLTKMEIPYIFE